MDPRDEMQQTLMEHLRESELAQQWRAVETATTLEAMMAAAWVLTRELMLLLIRQVLETRAAPPTNWPGCEVCGKRLQSKGWAVRQWTGWVGTLRWKRRVGRCPSGCRTGQVAPLDKALALVAYARTSVALQEMACLLAVWVPFELVTRLLARLTGVEVSASGVWNWVQVRGRQAVVQLEEELERLAQGERPAPETLAPEVAALPVMLRYRSMGTDGVKVPF